VPSKKALVRRPSPRLAEGLVTHIEREKADADLAVEQWEAYVEALRTHGWETIEVDPADDCPDAVFVEDTVVMYRNVALIARPGAESRRAETSGVEEAVAGLGCSVNWIWEPGTLDGGDVLKIGDTVYVGRGGRPTVRSSDTSPRWTRPRCSRASCRSRRSPGRTWSCSAVRSS
jgi:dimethylargininase